MNGTESRAKLRRRIERQAAAEWEAPHPLRVDDDDYYLVKTNGGEWRDPDLHLWRGYRVKACLVDTYVRGRPVLIAKVTDPEIAIPHPCK